jgi:hypothetical protein
MFLLLIVCGRKVLLCWDVMLCGVCCLAGMMVSEQLAGRQLSLWLRVAMDAEIGCS